MTVYKIDTNDFSVNEKLLHDIYVKLYMEVNTKSRLWRLVDDVSDKHSQ